MLPMLVTRNEKFQYVTQIPQYCWMRLVQIVENFPACWLRRTGQNPWDASWSYLGFMQVSVLALVCAFMKDVGNSMGGLTGSRAWGRGRILVILYYWSGRDRAGELSLRGTGVTCLILPRKIQSQEASAMLCDEQSPAWVQDLVVPEL